MKFRMGIDKTPEWFYELCKKSGGVTLSRKTLDVIGYGESIFPTVECVDETFFLEIFGKTRVIHRGDTFEYDGGLELIHNNTHLKLLENNRSDD